MTSTGQHPAHGFLFSCAIWRAFQRAIRPCLRFEVASFPFVQPVWADGMGNRTGTLAPAKTVVLVETLTLRTPEPCDFQRL